MEFKEYILNEERYTLKGKKIHRLNTDKIGVVVREEAYGKAYEILWNDGSRQHLGRSTICDKKKYELSDFQPDEKEKCSEWYKV
jgi:hypothetical protein